MAIHPEVPGLEVKVYVQGQPLHEYDDDKIPEPKTTTKYIEARSDEIFSIMTVFKPPFPNQYDMGVLTCIDGVETNIKIRKRDEILQRPMSSNHCYSCQGGEWVKQKFTFAKLNIVEEADESAPVVALDQVLSIKGCITISLYFIENFQETGMDKTSYSEDRHQQLAALQDIPEKALKGDALSHQAVLSKPRKCHSNYSDLLRAHYRFVDKKPFATFHFKYRSLASIQALHLVSMNEAPPVPLEDRLAKDLSPEELRELLNRAQQRESESTSIKTEDEATTGVKRERTIDDDDDVTYVETRQRKRPHVEQEVVVIDRERISIPSSRRGVQGGVKTTKDGMFRSGSEL